MTKTKRCTLCGVEKPLEDFWKNTHPDAKDGRHWWCRPCAREKYKGYRSNYDKAYRRNIDLKSRYGITEHDYQLMYSTQKGLCAICEHPGLKLVVDHDHKTGEVRGLLCRKCNLTLGHWKDSVVLINRALEYLAGPFGEAYSNLEVPVTLGRAA